MAKASKSAKKKTASSAPKSDAEFFAALFALVEKDGWNGLTLPAIARGTHVPLATLLEKYPDTHSILHGFAGFIDRQLTAVAVEDGALKDRLFDVVMQRLDALAPFRPGLIRLIGDLQANPFNALALGCDSFTATRRSASLMLALAGLRADQPFLSLLRTGFELVYLQTLRIWKNDTSADLSATMAALDRALQRLLGIARLL